MNTSTDNDKDHLRYAEYVLGLLDADARAAVAREVAEQPEAAAAVGRWQAWLNPLAVELPAVAPPAAAWEGIRSRLGLGAQARPGLWESLALWRWLGVGATAVAACLLVLTLTRPGLPAPPTATTPAVLMVSTIARDDGVASWTATMDPERGELLLVPATPEPLASGRDTELWLIPEGAPPIAVGVFPAAQGKRFALPRALVDRLGPTAALAVSVEPAGGSPTGQPTGPVIAKGAIRAA
ncbi:anti-sigma factor [Luteibacter aegosomaticola]|uniref:anti-sigma factor n=1 Tax=Luteibacter aegosomaticola TaxID=2911538 RepID=UPI001FF753EA|nr:anti-sigma factor [Luteibacter aegosomaticola]UPG91972.1 anti-sigma factor [Luteibacter aegosomaticola]